MKVFILVVLLSFSNYATAIKTNAIAGGVITLDFSSDKEKIKAFYGKARLLTKRVNNSPPYNYQIFVGIPLLTQVGAKQIQVVDTETKTLVFKTYPHKYQTQYITLKKDKKKYVNPDPENTKRLLSEREILHKARTHFSDIFDVETTFIPPASGIITSVFGTRRFYNNQPRLPHTGIDYAIAENTPILAPASGRVILIGDFFFNGNTVFLDHGQGLISVFIHLNKALVEQNQFVNKGDIIALSGQTGRATGPHLHWGTYLNQTAVNPSSFLTDDKQ